MNYIDIENRKGLVRDLNSRAILNVDSAALQRHKQRIEEKQKLKQLHREVNSLKEDISELKNLITNMVRTNG